MKRLYLLPILAGSLYCGTTSEVRENKVEEKPVQNEDYTTKVKDVYTVKPVVVPTKCDANKLTKDELLRCLFEEDEEEENNF